MKRFKIIVLALLVVLGLIQLFQPKRNNKEQVQPAELTKVFSVPQDVATALKLACYDCHSNHTNYPWYAPIQPFGWLLAHHIGEGKAELNFSEFGSYSRRRQISKLNEVANSIKDGSMPLGSYTLMHKNARLSKEKKSLIIDWVTRTKDSLRQNK